MPNYDVSVRQDWFLPLIGGAELNRIKLPNPIIFTSRPYPVEAEDAATTYTEALPSFTIAPWDAAILGHVTLAEAVLRSVSQSYTRWDLEPVQTNLPALVSGELRSQLQAYTLPRDEAKTSNVALTAGTLQALLIRYTRWAVEPIQTSLPTLTAGTLT